MALEPGRGRSAVPVRSTILTATLGVATMASVLGFSTSLRDLFNDPQRYGWNWDIQVGDAFSPALDDEAARLNSHPAVTAASIGTTDRLQIGSLLVDVLAVEGLRGSIEPTVVQGRAPSRPGEILLGVRTLRELHLKVGDEVSVTRGASTARLRVVGSGVLTEFAGGARLGEGATLTLAGMRSLRPDAAADVVLLRLRPGAEGQELVKELVATHPANIYLPLKPSDLRNLERAGGLPSVAAAILEVMAVLTVSHTLITSVRRRRRDLAILKSLGFEPRQISAAVAWQATAVALISLALGIPLGIITGRWAWQLFAGWLGVPSVPATPILALAALAAVTLLLANLAAALPARMAARTATATELRAE